MGLFDRFRRSAPPDPGEHAPAEFYALYESQRPFDPDDEDDDERAYRPASAAPDYRAWDEGLAQVDAALHAE